MASNEPYQASAERMLSSTHASMGPPPHAFVFWLRRGRLNLYKLPFSPCFHCFLVGVVLVALGCRTQRLLFYVGVPSWLIRCRDPF